ncbi:hypothetical protein HK097_007729 [Rhizophlyctis rosea]|uniref:Uncharacterized protein n=1 Tax=Rhizophlyctis rosea TaxID=64517 RepID=A0AAD5X1G9_9FUNG|nr:hypothetical protein HK097_007729 [Rhizophlyctis rosea]
MKRTYTSASDRSVVSFLARLRPLKIHKERSSTISEGTCQCGESLLTTSSTSSHQPVHHLSPLTADSVCCVEGESEKRKKKRKGRRPSTLPANELPHDHGVHFTWAGKIVGRFVRKQKHNEAADGVVRSRRGGLVGHGEDEDEERMDIDFDSASKRMSSDNLTAMEFAQMTHLNVLYRTDEEEERERGTKGGSGLAKRLAKLKAGDDKAVGGKKDSKTSVFDPKFWAPPREKVTDGGEDANKAIQYPPSPESTIRGTTAEENMPSSKQQPTTSPQPVPTLTSSPITLPPSPPTTLSPSSPPRPRTSSTSTRPSHHSAYSPLRTSLSSIRTHSSTSTSNLTPQTPTEPKVHRVGRFTVIVEPNPAVDATYLEYVQRRGGTDIVEENPELSRFRRESLEEEYGR